MSGIRHMIRETNNQVRAMAERSGSTRAMFEQLDRMEKKIDALLIKAGLMTSSPVEPATPPPVSAARAEGDTADTPTEEPSNDAKKPDSDGGKPARGPAGPVAAGGMQPAKSAGVRPRH